jgi:hypothetical protein
MSNLYLLESNHEENNSSNVIIDLDKALTIRCFKVGHAYVMQLDYTTRDAIRALFDTEERLRNSLFDIFLKMTRDEILAKQLSEKCKVKIINENVEDALSMLKVLHSAMEAMDSVKSSNH